MTSPAFHDHAPNAWTEERVALLRKLWAEGLTAAAIASRLGGTTKNAVIGKADRLGLSGRQSGRATLLTVEERRARKNQRQREWRAIQKVTVAIPERKNHGRTLSEDRALARASHEAVRVGAAGGANAPAPIPSAPIKLIRPPPDGRVTVQDLSDKTCRWPEGHVGEPDFRFCGAPTKANSVYCEHHHDRAYTGIPVSRNADKRNMAWRHPRFAT
jgi:GcrA cell cycle regulator